MHFVACEAAPNVQCVIFVTGTGGKLDRCRRHVIGRVGFILQLAMSQDRIITDMQGGRAVTQVGPHTNMTLVKRT